MVSADCELEDQMESHADALGDDSCVAAERDEPVRVMRISVLFNVSDMIDGSDPRSRWPT